MPNTTLGEETLNAKMSAKELASYEWRAMGDFKGRALFEGFDPIKVTVGTGFYQKIWCLPKKVLTHCSPFFSAALNGNFAEASLEAVHLPEDDPMAFELWASWLYLGKPKHLPIDAGDDLIYVRAWILGDKFACPAFKDYVMLKLLDWFEPAVVVWGDSDEEFPAEAIILAYQGCPPGSKLRRFCVEWFVWAKLNGHLIDFEEQIITVSKEVPEFFEDCLRIEIKADKETVPDPSNHKYRYYENPTFKPDA